MSIGAAYEVLGGIHALQIQEYEVQNVCQDEEELEFVNNKN